MNPLKRRVTVGLFAVALVAAACGSGSSTSTSAKPSRGFTGSAGQAAVKGSGTDDDPFIGPCDDPRQVDCTVSSFPPRKLNGWAQDGPKDEFMRAYKCPDDHPYLLRQNYAPPGSSWTWGVSFNRDPSWVNIYAGSPGLQVSVPSRGNFALRNVGTRGPIAGGSVTNYNAVARTWQAVLHCTSDYDQSY